MMRKDRKKKIKLLIIEETIFNKGEVANPKATIAHTSASSVAGRISKLFANAH
jgi:hypothetical protein